MPDTAETVWLDRRGNIWLVNSDGTTGRKLATLSSGMASFTGLDQVGHSSLGAAHWRYTDFCTRRSSRSRSTALRQSTSGADPRDRSGRRRQSHSGSPLAFSAPPPNVDSTATVVLLDGGTDEETDDQLRARILLRIRNPPMGGDQNDYVQWALARARLHQGLVLPERDGIGTVTVRVMFDDLRADQGGLSDANGSRQPVTAYIDQMRPVTVKDRWVLSPIPQPIDVHIGNLNPGDDTTKANIEVSLEQMLFNMASPGATIYAAWKSYAIMNAPGVHLVRSDDRPQDDVMPSNGYMAVLGDIYYDQ